MSVFTGCGDNHGRAFDAKSGALKRTYTGHECAISCLQVERVSIVRAWDTCVCMASAIMLCQPSVFCYLVPAHHTFAIVRCTSFELELARWPRSIICMMHACQSYSQKLACNSLYCLCATTAAWRSCCDYCVMMVGDRIIEQSNIQAHFLNVAVSIQYRCRNLLNVHRNMKKTLVY